MCHRDAVALQDGTRRATLMGGSHGAHGTLGTSPPELRVSQPHTPLSSPFKVQRRVLGTQTGSTRPWPLPGGVALADGCPSLSLKALVPQLHHHLGALCVCVCLWDG